jgi:hypothetical protein
MTSSFLDAMAGRESESEEARGEETRLKMWELAQQRKL